MAKGPEVTNEIRLLATRLHKEHPKWTNKEIRNWILKSVHENDPSLPESWPSKYTIDRIMPGVRERVRLSKLEPNPLDKQWTVQSMADPKYHIAPEAVPSVLRVWYWAKELEYAITIREAQWVSRLYAAIEDTEALFAHSNFEADLERYCEEAGVENMGHQFENWELYSTMTGYEISSDEEAARLIKLDREPVGFKRILANPKTHTGASLPWPHTPEILREEIKRQSNRNGGKGGKK